MKVLVDTTVWSLALRRKTGDLNTGEKRIVREWTELVKDGRAVLIGPMRQEILSGIKHESEFEKLREYLANFDDIPLSVRDYEQAARLFNLLRAAGIVGTPIDLLICAAAYQSQFDIFTTDPDFARYARRLPIRLYALKTL